VIPEFDLLTVIIVLVAALQVYVSLRAALDGAYTRKQKTIQILIVWLVPFFGAVLVYSFLAADKSPPKDLDTHFTPDGGSNPPGIQ
jgi:hypothetical protein